MARERPDKAQGPVSRGRRDPPRAQGGPGPPGGHKAPQGTTSASSLVVDIAPKRRPKSAIDSTRGTNTRVRAGKTQLSPRSVAREEYEAWLSKQQAATRVLERRHGWAQGKLTPHPPPRRTPLLHHSDLAWQGRFQGSRRTLGRSGRSRWTSSTANPSRSPDPRVGMAHGLRGAPNRSLPPRRRTRLPLQPGAR